ncbi:MAG TPA: hypothetical protein VKT28_08730 [Puia sp.]|nr:hypothetical protein [Puia sp.]
MNNQDLLRAAHQHSIFNKDEILESQVCGCFYCLKNFAPQQITEWVEEGDNRHETALCPFCSIDSVIGNKSGYKVDDKNFLKTMYDYFFA